jgi:hypothetical protein
MEFGGRRGMELVPSDTVLSATTTTAAPPSQPATTTIAAPPSKPATTTTKNAEDLDEDGGCCKNCSSEILPRLEMENEPGALERSKKLRIGPKPLGGGTELAPFHDVPGNGFEEDFPAALEGILSHEEWSMAIGKLNEVITSCQRHTARLGDIFFMTCICTACVGSTVWMCAEDEKQVRKLRDVFEELNGRLAERRVRLGLSKIHKVPQPRADGKPVQEVKLRQLLVWLPRAEGEEVEVPLPAPSPQAMARDPKDPKGRVAASLAKLEWPTIAEVEHTLEHGEDGKHYHKNGVFGNENIIMTDQLRRDENIIMTDQLRRLKEIEACTLPLARREHEKQFAEKYLGWKDPTLDKDGRDKDGIRGHLEAAELNGIHFACMCPGVCLPVPFAWSIYQAESLDDDRLRARGVSFALNVIPCPFDELRVRDKGNPQWNGLMSPNVW